MKIKIGVTLFLLYLLQALLPWSWPFMEQLQSNLVYKKWTGLLLLLLILFQWTLVLSRVVFELNGAEKERYINWHKWIGVFSPFFYYVHSASPGYGFLLFLTILFFVNFVWGFFKELPFAWSKNLRYVNFWLSGHILLSVLVLVLSFLHVWVVFYYN